MYDAEIHTNRFIFPDGTIKTEFTSEIPNETEMFEGRKIVSVVGGYDSDKDYVWFNIKLGDDICL